MDTDAINQALADMSRKAAERMDYELRGAWRAGYDYLHVYDTLACEGLRGDPFSVQQAILASNGEEPPEPPGYRYKYTYDIGAVDDAVIRAAIRERGEDG